ncbi:hypothetical protein [Conexibacter sp. SYSU D00693]|uniref:phosphorylase family protein n=1 Tax=Conexibacter sp. SYSU D00693 TaxID=2812560 RepID=UPI00196AA046|nr:hypothetical protein [Conexibacter sp. SYSU D00693]
MASQPIHVHPTAELAPRVLLPGDPGRALALAQVLLGDDRRMFNHNRGLWGYSGTAADGAPLTIQSTGMGGPSAAIVLEELADLGAEVAVRVGTCGALDGDLALGQLLAAGEVLAADGTSRALGAGERVAVDAGLAAALADAAGTTALVVSTDLFYDRDDARAASWKAQGAAAVEMEAAALAAVAARRDVRFGCVLAVTDLLEGGRERISPEGLEAAGEAVGRAAAHALGCA